MREAAIVINLYYEEERRKAKSTQGARTDISPDLGLSLIGKTSKILAEKAGVGKTNIEYLMAVKKKRPDLFEQVFIGKYSINKAYTEMKRDEAPPVTEEQRIRELDEKQADVVKALSVAELGASQYDSSKPMTDPYNVAVGVRKTALSTSASIINDTQALKVASELEGERSTYSEIGLNALYHIATMPEEAREIPHIIPSTGETKTVDEMTVRELREVKKARLIRT